MNTESNFDIESISSLSNKSLSLHLHPSYFNFCITDNDKHIQLCSSKIWDDKLHQINPTDLSDWLNTQQEIFNIPYQKIDVCINSFSFSIIDDKNLATQKSFQILNEFSELTHQLNIDKIQDNLYVQYAINKRVIKTLKTYFDKESFKFGDYGFLNGIVNSDSKPNDSVFCQILQNELTIAAIENHKLRFFNKFRTKNQEDILYYILSVYQNCNLDPNQNTLFLTGLIEAKSPLYDLIYNYIRNVEFTAGFNKKKMADKNFTASEHYFFNLFNII